MWFVYTYIMYGDSDNDESSTNTHTNTQIPSKCYYERMTMNDVTKAFSVLSFRHF